MKKCSVQDCDNKSHAKNMCKSHYLRWYRHGNTEKIDRKATAPRGSDLPQTKHGLWSHPLYPTWHSMIARCESKSNKKYHRYGGRGIYVCDRWKSIENFIADMGEKPKGYSLDRINNDGPYSPENCRWADKLTQARNRPQALLTDEQRKNAIELYKKNGSPKLISQILGISVSSVKNVVYMDKKINGQPHEPSPKT